MSVKPDRAEEREEEEKGKGEESGKMLRGRREGGRKERGAGEGSGELP